MQWLDRMARKMGRHYIPDLMKYLIFAMAGVLVLQFLPLKQNVYVFLSFDRKRILQGEVWRALTFVFLPPSGKLIWSLLTLYFYYLVATALESRWGGARFNLYYLIGIAANLVSGFACGYATNVYLNLTLLIAFGILYAEAQLLLFFFIPVKAKWISLAVGLYCVYQAVVSPWPMRLAMLASFLPFILFFGKDAWLILRMEYRRIRRLITLRRWK